MRFDPVLLMVKRLQDRLQLQEISLAAHLCIDK